MGKIIFLIIFLITITILFYGLPVSAKTVRVLYNLDGTISVIHPAPKSQRATETEEQWLQKVFDKANPEGLDYEDIDSSELPSREKRNAWRGNKASGLFVDEQAHLDSQRAASVMTIQGLNLKINDKNGNVGIGTTKPGYKLDVNGDAGINGGLTVQGKSLFEGSATTTGSLYIAGDLSVNGLTLFQGESLEITDWNQAYNWGDHTGVGYLTSYAEIDPIFASSIAAGITSTDTTNWSLAYSWGNHTNQNYFIKGTDILNDIALELYYSNGSLGIGTTTTSTGPVSMSARLLIQGLGITDSTNALSVINASSTSLLLLTDNGNMGIATTTPTNILTIGQGQGNAIADGWDVYSSEEFKTDITYLEEQDYDDILEQIEGVNLARYRWKSEDKPQNDALSEGHHFEASSSNDKMLGVIVEDEGTPNEVLSNDGKSISLYDYASFALAGVKALKSEVDELKELLGVIENEDGSLSLIEEESEPVIITGDNGVQFQLMVDAGGYLVIDKLKVKDLEIVQGGQLTLPQGEDEIMGQGQVAISSDYAIIENNKILESSKIFVSFTSNLSGASWWVCDKMEGESFKVCLSEIASTTLSFDYWIVQGKIAQQVEEIVIPAPDTGTPVPNTGTVDTGAIPDTETVPLDTDFSDEDAVLEGTASSEDVSSETIPSDVIENPESQEESLNPETISPETISSEENSEFPKLPLSSDVASPDEQALSTETVPSEEIIDEPITEEVVIEELPVVEEPVAEEPVAVIVE